MSKRKLFTTVIICILVAVMMLGLMAPVFANAASDKSSSALKNELNKLEDEKAEIDDKIAELESQLSDNLSEMEAVVAQKGVIDQEIFMLHEQVENINKQIAAYGLLIADKQDELDAAQAQLEQLRQQNKTRIRTMEEEGDMTYWSVVLQANDFSDLLDRWAMAREIRNADINRIRQMDEAAKAVEQAKSELETEKAGLEAMKAELAASQEELEGKRQEADKLLKDLLATGAEYEALLDKAEQNVEELLDKISEKEAEYDEAKDREYQAWLATSEPPKYTAPSYSGGTAGAPNTVGNVTWLVPVNYTYFSSPYGYRVHPVYGDWRFHSGVDLAAASGTPIIASRGGRVKIATYDWSAGYYVGIDHLDGFETKYMHMTHYVVSEGEYVAPGQVIGYVGSTGTSTGPHLHFSVYYNGSSVNPANYIKIS